MIDPLLAGSGVSITELRRDPLAVIDAAGGLPIAVLNRDTPTAYLVPAKMWEALVDRLEDIALAEIVRARSGEKRVKLRLENL